jgi:hypothetical protein
MTVMGKPCRRSGRASSNGRAGWSSRSGLPGLVGSWGCAALCPLPDADGRPVRPEEVHPLVEVGSISLLRTGGPNGRALPIIPKDAWAKELVIPATAARDMKALQQWLGELLKEQLPQP